MEIFTRPKSVIMVLCMLMCLFLTQAQETIIEVPLSKQVEMATQVVEGKVIAKESFWDDTRSNIYTKQTIEVYKVFKGQPIETIELITIGGIVELEAQTVSHSLHLNNGDLGVFTLKQQDVNNLTQVASSNAYRPVSDAQSFYKYDLANNRAVNPFKNVGDIEANLYTQLQTQTNAKFVEVKPIESTLASQSAKTGSTYSKAILAPAITSFSATDNSAGTKSVLTINGSGFGTTKGTVGFSDANYGGSLHYDALVNQVISWMDNKIEVEIPDRAGTGTVKITTNGGQSITSSQSLTINFSQINLEYANSAYQTQHINSNGSGGNTWVMNQDFYSSGAKDAFTRAFENWSCGTGINWSISPSTTTISTNANDGINVISFDANMGGGTLGQCYSYYSGCYENGDIKWYVTGMDIVFNPNKTWNFSTNPPAYDEVDFESVTVHELGHGHQLGHVIDTNAVMHYSISSGESLRQLDSEDLTGAVDVQSRSTTTTVCSQELMTQSTCYAASLSVSDLEALENGIAMYPNPVQDRLSIKNTSQFNIDKIAIYNVMGKQVYRDILNNGNSYDKLNVDVSNLTRGMYLVKLESEVGTTTKKLLVN